MDALKDVSQVLVSTSMPTPYESVGRYYEALCIQRFGRGDVRRATCSFECVAETGPARYRGRAMQSLGSNAFHQTDYQSALFLYREASHFASREKIYDPYATLGTHK